MLGMANKKIAEEATTGETPVVEVESTEEVIEVEEISVEDLQDGDKIGDVDLDTGEVRDAGVIREINGIKYLESKDESGSTFLEPLIA